MGTLSALISHPIFRKSKKQELTFPESTSIYCLKQVRLYLKSFKAQLKT